MVDMAHVRISLGKIAQARQQPLCALRGGAHLARSSRKPLGASRATATIALRPRNPWAPTPPAARAA